MRDKADIEERLHGLRRHLNELRVRQYQHPSIEKQIVLIARDVTLLEWVLDEQYKTYEVWSEGYSATGDRGVARLMGRVEAKSFKGACDKLFENDSLFDPDRMTHWGCRLYDNEQDARRLFG